MKVIIALLAFLPLILSLPITTATTDYHCPHQKFCDPLLITRSALPITNTNSFHCLHGNCDPLIQVSRALPPSSDHNISPPGAGFGFGSGLHNSKRSTSEIEGAAPRSAEPQDPSHNTGFDDGRGTVVPPRWNPYHSVPLDDSEPVTTRSPEKTDGGPFNAFGCQANDWACIFGSSYGGGTGNNMNGPHKRSSPAAGSYDNGFTSHGAIPAVYPKGDPDAMTFQPEQDMEKREAQSACLDPSRPGCGHVIEREPEAQ